MTDLCKLFFIPLLFIEAAFVSCKKDDGETPEPQAPTSTISTTAYTSTVSGTIDGVVYDELNSGQRGILYNEGTDGAQTYFDSWLNGNNNPGCQQVGRIKVNTNGIMEVTLTKLKPETSYSFCLYYISRDGGTRLLSAPDTFTTKAFGCTLETAEAQSVGFYKAMVTGNVKTDVKDLEFCTTGIVLSCDVSEPVLDDGHKEANSIADDGAFEISLNELRCGTEYRYRTYLLVEHTGQLLYGPVRTFTTRHPDEQAVDLGLSVKWASCNLGAEEPQEWGGYYKWGETEPSTNADRSKYSLWNSYQNRYVDVGNNICGTEYDAAHEAMSGHWRMPTKDEIDELIESCEMTLHTMGEGYVAEFAGNGTSICVPAAGFYNSYGFGWAFDKGSDQCTIVFQSGERAFYANQVGNHERWCWYAQVNPQTNQVIVSSSSGTITGDDGGGVITGGSAPMTGNNGYAYEFAIPIRPVWDPNLRD